jgi:serine/threonine protein kinase
MDLTPGAVIAGRYRVERKVGAGGMGEVWAGEHRSVGSRVALKTLLSASACNHEVVARFKREAYILGRIRSDHVARVVDFVADSEYGLVLVMEFIEGDSLSRVLAERLLTIEETIELGADIASALVDLHQAHTVHRDLKPGNIILQPIHGERRCRAVVVDFGVSRLSLTGRANDEEEITGITRADMAVGTIEYMAPEQILNSRNVTSASDIYAAGAILYRAVAGRHVFGNIASDTELANKKLTTEPPNLSLSRQDKLAKGLAVVVMRALKRRPSERYKSAQELLNDLAPLRDLARVAVVDLDTTTVEQGSLLSHLPDLSDDGTAADAFPIGRLPLEPNVEALGRASVPSVPEDAATQPSLRTQRLTPAPSPSSPSLPPPPPKPRRGIPAMVVVGAVVSALAGGIALGSGILQQRLSEGDKPEATAAAAAATTVPASPSSSASSSAEFALVEPTAEASASAAPPLVTATATASLPVASRVVAVLPAKASPAAAPPKPAKSAQPPPSSSATAAPSVSVEPTVKPAPDEPPDAETYY